MKDITVSFGREGRMNRDKEVQNNVFIKFDVNFREKQLAELKGAPLSVFICLTLHMNEDGECWLSNDRIMVETGYGEEAIKNAKEFLAGKGYLQQADQQRWTEELVEKRFPKNAEQKKKEINYGTWAPAGYKLFPETTGRGLTGDGQNRPGASPTRRNPPDKEEPCFEVEPCLEEEPCNNHQSWFKLIEEKWQRPVSKYQFDTISRYLKDGLPEEVVEKAIGLAADKNSPFGYCKGILSNCLADDIDSVEDMELDKKEGYKQAAKF